MGARKHNRAEAIKEARKSVAIAHTFSISDKEVAFLFDTIRRLKKYCG